jgi:hypothetical protein
MSDTKEIIVKFKHGISEAVARAAVSGAGATVRRRMRTDTPNEVMLLVKVDGEVGAVEAKLKKYPSVLSTEINSGDYGVR